LVIISLIYPQEVIPVARKGLHLSDYLIVAKVPKNKWTAHPFIRIGIDVVE
jgi:hypothetical protein